MTPAGAESEMQRRLAEMVARLRAVQDELEQDLLPLDSEPEPAAPAPEPLAQALPADARLEAMCGSLLRALRELLSGYEVALAHARPGSGGEAAEVTLAAGPF